MSSSFWSSSRPGSAGGPPDPDHALEQVADAADAADSAGDTLGNPANIADNPDNPAEDPADSPEQPAQQSEQPADSGDTEATPDHAEDAEAPPPGSELVDDGVPRDALGRRRDRTYDWVAIRRRYVEGVPNRDAGTTDWPSLDAVAAHFGVVTARVKERSSMEGWVEQRARWQAQVEATRQQAKAAAMAREATQLDGRALDAAKMGLQLCITRLAELGQIAQQRRANSVASGVADSGLDAQEQQRLAYAVDLWHKIGLRAIGDPETLRLELTGIHGQPVEISQELRRDDPNRLAGVLSVLARAGVGDLFGGASEDADRAAAADGAADGSQPALGAGR